MKGTGVIMQKHFCRKITLLLGVLLISGSVYACDITLDDLYINNKTSETSTIQSINTITKQTSTISTIQTTPDSTQAPVLPNPTATPTATPISPSVAPTPTTIPIKTAVTPPEPTNFAVNTTPAPIKSIATPTLVTAEPSTAPIFSDEILSVRNTTLSLGDRTDSVLSKLGKPNRILDTEYDFDYYVYNNDYSNLVLVAIRNNQVVGFYTDATTFSFLGISPGSSLQAVNRALNKSFLMDEVLTLNTNNYTVKVLMDKIGTQKVTGIYVLSNTVKMEGYTESVMNNIEILVLDLTNSVRARHGVATLSWSPVAAVSSRKHSIDMANNNYFEHISLSGTNPVDRMKAEGIHYSTYGENIIAGYGTAIISNHGWFNSDGHRKNLLSTNFTHLGVGFTYEANSIYKNYITQNFHR